MQEYIFLFVVALIWIVFAAVQDLKTREVSNWLNFSLLAIVLAYRAFHSVIINDYEFLVLGLLGFVVFYLIGTAFYYSKVFAGGDTKLFWALGVVLPYSNYWDLLRVGGGFILLLFFVVK